MDWLQNRSGIFVPGRSVQLNRPSLDRIVAIAGAGAPPADAQYLQTGPNYNPAWGLSFWAAIDPRQADQSVLNTNLTRTPGYGDHWLVPETSPNNGAFFNNIHDGDPYVRFEWAIGQDTRCAGCELRPDTPTPTEFYIRALRRRNADWEWAAVVKDLFIQGTGDQNTAAGLDMHGGLIMTLNVTPNALGTTTETSSEWVEDEYYWSAVPSGTCTCMMWRDGVLEYNDTIATTTGDVYQVFLGPYHGGSGAKTQGGDYWDYKCLLLYAA